MKRRSEAGRFAMAIGLILMLMLPVSVVHAEDASVLLGMYDKVSDPEPDRQKLEQLQKQFDAMARDVSSRTMLNSAHSLEQAFENERLVQADLTIKELSDRLIELEEAMKLQTDADVDTIMKLDAEYRRSADLLERKRQERQSITNDSSLESQDTELVRDTQKLERLRVDLERQRERVKELSEFAELGDITGFTTPIGIRVRMTSPFGDRIDPVTNDGTTFHAGIDLEASAGTPVLSAFNGRVAKTGKDDEIGLYVWVEHGNGIRTMYGHLSSISVTAGQEVLQYEPIALSGNTGSRTTGEHLHFTVTINGIAVDPAVFVHTAG